MYSEEIAAAVERFMTDENINFYGKDNIFHFTIGDIGKLHMSIPVRVIIRDDSYLILVDYPIRAGNSIALELTNHISKLNYSLLQGRWEYLPSEDDDESSPIRFCIYVPCIYAGLGYTTEEYYFKKALLATMSSLEDASDDLANLLMKQYNDDNTEDDEDNENFLELIKEMILDQQNTYDDDEDEDDSEDDDDEEDDDNNEKAGDTDGTDRSTLIEEDTIF